MSAVIRVKRRIDEEPLDAFILNCKKRRVDDTYDDAAGSSSTKTTNKTNLLENPNEKSTVLKFAGTIQNEESITSHISRLTKIEAKEATQKHRQPNPTTKSRQQSKLDSQENRFKVVNCYRTLENEEGSGPNFTVVDIVKQEAESDETATEKKTEPIRTDGMSLDAAAVSTPASDYVYDLYLPENDDQIEFDGNLIDDLISVRPFDYLVYQTQDDGFDDSDNSDDSNDENHWANEYPDTDDNFSVGEADMRKAIEDLDFDDDRALSSDESDYGPEPVVHFLEGDESAEYDFLKRNGHLPSRVKYGRAARSRGTFQDDSDIDDDISASDDDESDCDRKSGSDILSDED